MIEKQFKHIVTNGRVHQGTLTISDHRILVTTMKVDWYLVHKQKNRKTNNVKLKVDTQKIIHDKETQKVYRETVKDKIEKSDKSWGKVAEIVIDTAKKVIGCVKRTNKKTRSDNERIEKLSKPKRDQDKLKIQMTPSK